MTKKPADGRVVIVERKPHGRKRTGGGYIGRSEWLPFRLTPTMRRLGERLAGPEWRTIDELAEAAGLTEKQLRPRLSELRRLGAAEFIVRRSLSRAGEKSELHLPGAIRPARHGCNKMFYQIERVSRDASE
jgi:hypothetical protein